MVATGTLIALALAASAPALDCRFAPAARHIVLAELFSSEGCDACPPAERFFNGLKADGEIVPIVWHVNYFDDQGWKDRFALAESSRRQQALAQAQPSAKIVATPQVFLDGRGFGAWRDPRAFRSRVLRSALPASGPSLALARVERAGDGLRLELHVEGAGPGLRWQAALLQGGLQSQVTQGENQGLSLQHDHVVRSATGPLAAASGAAPRVLQLRLPLPASDGSSAARGADVVAWAEDAEGVVVNATWASCAL